MKRQKESESESDRKDEMDRLSDLPDSVLLYILEFMNTKDAVQTCVLSKRWKDLWKRLTILKLYYSYFRTDRIFNNFVSQIMSCRDGNIPLLRLDFYQYGLTKTTLLKVMKYALSHNVQELSINTRLSMEHIFKLPHRIFSSRSLTVLKLSFWCSYCQPFNLVKFAKSLELPALESLHLAHVTFSTADDGCAEPFSTCKMLNTLEISCCHLETGAKVLCISNSKLCILTIDSTYGEKAYKIALSTPNLSSVTTKGRLIHELSSACNLPFLEEVNIDVFIYEDVLKNDLVLISWLQVLANVKIMSLSSTTLKILKDLSNPGGSVRTQPPCFVRLKSLKVKMCKNANISDHQVSRTVEYVLQNSPLARVDIINC